MKTNERCKACDSRLVDDEDGLHCPECGWEPSLPVEPYTPLENPIKCPVHVGTPEPCPTCRAYIAAGL